MRYNEAATLKTICSLYDLARFGGWQRDCRVFMCDLGLPPKLPLSHDDRSPPSGLLWLGPPSDLSPSTWRPARRQPDYCAL
jgi:hypothetical protein